MSTILSFIRHKILYGKDNKIGLQVNVIASTA